MGYIYVVVKTCMQKLQVPNLLLGGVVVLVPGWFVDKVGLILGEKKCWSWASAEMVLGAVCSENKNMDLEQIAGS